jgi:hypothetical protein
MCSNIAFNHETIKANSVIPRPTRLPLLSFNSIRLKIVRNGRGGGDLTKAENIKYTQINAGGYSAFATGGTVNYPSTE